MGEGLYRSADGRTAYAEPFEDLEADDIHARIEALDDLEAAILGRLSPSWHRVDREFRRGGERVFARNGLHEIWLHQDSHDRVHVTFGLRSDLDRTERLARALVDERSEAFFDRLQMFHELRVRTSAWTSASRMPRKVAA